MWRWGDKNLVESEKYQIRSEGYNHFLRITDIDPEDAGEYTCSVRNHFGHEAHTTATLKVTGKLNAILIR